MTPTPLAEFVDCLFEPKDLIEVRQLPSKRSTWHLASGLVGQHDRLARENVAGQNIYAGINPRCRRGGTAGDVALARAFFADWDGGVDEVEARRRCEAAGLPEPTLLIHSGHGVHAYWRFSEALSDLAEWSAMQKALIAAVGSDKSIHDPPRIMRLPGFDNVKRELHVPCLILAADPNRRYESTELRAILAENSVTTNGPECAVAPISTRMGDTANPNAERARRYLAKIDGAVSGQHGHDRTFHAACVLVLGFNLTPDDAWPVLAEWNQSCDPPWDEADLWRKLNEADKQTVQRGYLLGESTHRAAPLANTDFRIDSVAAEQVIESDAWPEPLASEAFHGVAGELVRMIEPHSEADPAALLIQFLTGFGNLIGRNAYFRTEGDFHSGKLFCCLVGPSSKGRKGTSWGQIEQILGVVDPTWTETRVLSGLSSGEGLIWSVRDAIMKQEPIREKRRIVGYQEVEADPGVNDKRLLVLESELGSVLRVLRRESNTLSPVVRDAWDKANLRTLTKNSPAVSTGCHISIIGHITRQELRRHLTETDMANGFANRFIWFCVKRSKCLPEGGNLCQEDFSSALQRLQQAANHAANCGEVRRDAAASAIWREVYPKLSGGRPGLLGAVTSRAEAQTMRMALLYALLDASPVIRDEHLLAALAVWDYAEASARHIFGAALGDPTADEILRALRAAGARGMTRTDLSNHFRRNRDATEIGRALAVLIESGLARCEKTATGEQGRPEERWYAV